MANQSKKISEIQALEVALGWSKTPSSHFETYSPEEIKEHLRELKKSLKGKK
jgi:hypothetical protein